MIARKEPATEQATAIGPQVPTDTSDRSDGAQPSVELDGVSKRFDDLVAVRNLSLKLREGEFFTLLGPSGCGKTTTLRIVAGFERPSAGRVLIDGADVAELPPHRRPTNTVFQSYALFPHLSVRENVAFGLRRKRVPRGEIARRVGEELERVGLAAEANRKPNQLSGGMQQRVALARALVNLPKVLLLDEPLGALDLKLRKGLQVELKRIQREVGVTFIYVTHDQEEALTMSDRIAVMNNGRVEQAGEPQSVYEEPATLFVADFLGVSNLVTAEATSTENGCCFLQFGDRTLRADQGDVDARGEVKAMIRPERVRVEPHGGDGPNRLPGMLEHVVFLGSFRELHLRLVGGSVIEAVTANDGEELPYEQGTPVTLHLPEEAIRVLAPSA